MTKKTRSYTAEFKQEAIQLALKSPNIEQTARSLGIPPATLHTWLHNLKTKKAVSPAKQVCEEKDIGMLLEENRRLHKELAIAKEEKEILKKAAAYFAQHQK